MRVSHVRVLEHELFLIQTNQKKSLTVDMSLCVLLITTYKCYRPMNTFTAKDKPACVLGECNTP